MSGGQGIAPSMTGRQPCPPDMKIELSRNPVRARYRTAPVRHKAKKNTRLLTLELPGSTGLTLSSTGINTGRAAEHGDPILRYELKAISPTKRLVSIVKASKICDSISDYSR